MSLKLSKNTHCSFDDQDTKHEFASKETQIYILVDTTLDDILFGWGLCAQFSGTLGERLGT